jgi:hypothetical protein
MGEQIKFQEKPLDVGKWTTLIIVGLSKVPHEKRNQYLLDKVEKIRSALGTNNSTICKVVIETYSSAKELSSQMLSILDKEGVEKQFFN